MSYDGLVNEGLAECFSLHYVFHGCAEGNARLACGSNGNRETLVVEVGHAASVKMRASTVVEYSYMYFMPIPSSPIKFSTGTLTSSSSINVVPAET